MSPRGAAPTTDVQGNAQALTALIDQRIHLMAPGIAGQVARSVPPGGRFPLGFAIVGPVANPSVEVASLPVLCKATVESVLLVGDVEGTASVDIWRARPGELVPSASLFDTDLPVLAAGRIGWNLYDVETHPLWIPYIEPGSVLFYYVVTVSGLGRLDFYLNVRALNS